MTRSVLTAIAIVVIAGAIALWLWPDPPPFPQRQSIVPYEQYFERMEPDCLAVLARPEEFAGNPRQMDECADKAAVQKKNYADLAQSMRSANAAEEAAWFTYLQARISIVGAALLILTLGATAWAAWAAAVAARIADDSVAVTADTAKRQLRAYVTSGGFKFEPIRNVEGGGVGYLCTHTWKNNASTPALNVVIKINQTDINGSAATEFYLADHASTEPSVKSVNIIGPGQTSSTDMTISPLTAMMIMSGHHDHFIWGWIEYDDVFTPETPRRRTEFCVKVKPQVGSEGNRMGHVSYTYYNAMDEGCYREIQTPRPSRTPKSH